MAVHSSLTPPCNPDAAAFARAVAKVNCGHTIAALVDAVTHFKRRMEERGDSPEEVVIVLVNARDVHGGPLARTLIPEQNWDEPLGFGQAPQFARGLAPRDEMQEVLASFDAEAASKLKEMSGVAIVVVDHGVAEVYAG